MNPIGGRLCVCVYRDSKQFSFDESIVFRYMASKQRFRLDEAGGQCMTSRHWPTKLVMSWEAVGDV